MVALSIHLHQSEEERKTKITGNSPSLYNGHVRYETNYGCLMYLQEYDGDDDDDNDDDDDDYNDDDVINIRITRKRRRKEREISLRAKKTLGKK